MEEWTLVVVINERVYTFILCVGFVCDKHSPVVALSGHSSKYYVIWINLWDDEYAVNSVKLTIQQTDNLIVSTVHYKCDRSIRYKIGKNNS